MLKEQIINERVEKNLKVLKLLANTDCRLCSEEQRAILNEYTGWGGLRDAIYTPHIYKELKHYLSDAKIESIKNSTSSAYYTPSLLVKFMWSMLCRLGFKGGDILEPAAGIGAFLDNMPELIYNNSRIDAVEMDLLTSQILAAKYPELNISCTGFENLNYGNKKYDLIISNPPYSSQLVEDIYYKDLSHLAIHHFFVGKSARLLKRNGIIAMVVPQFFLDNIRDHARVIIAASGVNMVAAYRLPDNLFTNAKITVDIVFLHKAIPNIAWQETKDIKIGNYTKPMNEYFVANPDHILGELEVVRMYERMGITCKESGILRDKLKEVFLKTKKS
jgi:type I restriction-modification system DNA methylase subunit